MDDNDTAFIYLEMVLIVVVEQNILFYYVVFSYRMNGEPSIRKARKKSLLITTTISHGGSSQGEKGKNFFFTSWL